MGPYPNSGSYSVDRLFGWFVAEAVLMERHRSRPRTDNLTNIEAARSYCHGNEEAGTSAVKRRWAP